MRQGENDGLRRLAIGKLNPYSAPLTREALESGVVEVEPNVLAWNGTMGTVHGHLVVLWLEPELCRRVNEAPSAIDGLTAALASAVAQASGHALAELKVLPRAGTARGSTAYRGRL